MDSGTPASTLAEGTGLGVETLEKWYRKYGKGNASKGPADLLGAALRASGATAEEKPASEEKTAQEAPRAASTSEPVLTGEDVLAIVKGIDGVLVATIAGARNKRVPREEFLKLTAFSAETEKRLRPFAPAAAKLAPQVLAHADKVMAILFVAIWGFDVSLRCKAVWARDRELQK